MVKPADDAANGMKHLGQRFGLAEVAVPIVTSRPHTAGCDALRRVCARPGGERAADAARSPALRAAPPCAFARAFGQRCRATFSLPASL